MEKNKPQIRKKPLQRYRQLSQQGYKCDRFMYICSQYHKTMPLKIIDNIYKSDLDISLSKLDPLDSLEASGVATMYAWAYTSFGGKEESQ